jgi:conjugal transfer pilus assembly protein TraF
MKRLFMVALLFLSIGQHAVWAQSEPTRSGTNTASWWAGSIWDDPDRTYQWYPPDPQPPQSPDKDKKPELKSPPDLPSIKTVEALRKEVDRLRDQAIMSAKPLDVQAFLAAQQFLLEKSSVFADVARRVVWSTPDIDYSLRHPTDGMAIQAYNYGERVQQEQAITEAMKHYGVYFFMSSTCPYCRMQAQALKQLEMTTGLQVLPISLDGHGIPGYAHPLPDNGISTTLAQRFGLDRLSTPALFLVPKDNPGVPPIPISFGMASSSEIMERIYALTQTQPGQQF